MRTIKYAKAIISAIGNDTRAQAVRLIFRFQRRFSLVEKPIYRRNISNGKTVFRTIKTQSSYSPLKSGSTSQYVYRQLHDENLEEEQREPKPLLARQAGKL